MWFSRKTYNARIECTGGKRWSDRKRANPYGVPTVILKMNRLGVWQHLVTICVILAKMNSLAKTSNYGWIAPPCKN